MGDKRPIYIPILGVFILVLTIALMTECAARFAFSQRTRIAAKTNYPYEILDEHNRRLWRLRPGYSLTLAELIEVAQRERHVLATKYLKESAAELGFQPKDVLFRINQDGFKGPELDKGHSHFRILTLGDSCTFGSWFDQYSYPRTLERELRQLEWNVEVVNAGVQGYGTEQVLARIEEFKALKPELTTIYIGWNGLADSGALPDNYFRFYTPWLLSAAYKALFPERAALAAYTKPKHLNKADPELRRLDAYVPPFMNGVEQIVQQMQSSGSTVVIVTLPSLLTSKEEPTERALQIGHLPGFTDNPYVLAKMVEQYNADLRNLAMRSNLQVIDLEKWSVTALQPRDAYFTDTVHLSEKGQQAIGKYMAGELLHALHVGYGPAGKRANSPAHR